MAIKIALVGNPNSGKTTLFNQLTGSRQYVGNWPGVTVERKAGTLKGETEVELVDLPGIYSLSPYTNEEIVSRDFLASGDADAILNIVDASNLERNLYLTTQVMEFGLPVVVALNQMDIVRKRGYKIDSAKLAEKLGCEVVEISALYGDGVDDAAKAVIAAAKSGKEPAAPKFSAEVETYLRKIEGMLPASVPAKTRRYEAVKLFERDELATEKLGSAVKCSDVIAAAEKEFDDKADGIITNERYKFITSFIGEVQERSITGLTASEKIDRILTHRVLALPIFVAIISLVYYIAISTVGTAANDWVNDGVFGEDGWFFAGIGAEAYDEDKGAYDDAQNDISAYITAAEEAGVDTSEITKYVGEDAEEDADLTSAQGVKTLKEFSEDCEKAKVVGTTHLVDEDTGEVDEHEVALEDFQAGLLVAEPNPSEYGPWVPSIPSLCESGLKAIDAPEWLHDLCIDGIVAGVGAVLGFVPQIMVLFFLLAILEGCGYMARVTFILDRIFRRFGLSGKTFIPMIIGTGCGVPGIMASRTIESESSRHLTVMTTTFMPCSAKLPAISLICTAFFDGAWWVAPMAYFLGIASIIISGIMLKKTKPFMGETTPYIMELPEYRMPRLVDLLLSMWERAWAFIKKAGTIILLATIIVWFLSNYGFDAEGVFGKVDMDSSLLAGFGNALCWIFVPLGWGNWEATSAAFTGLLAKENLVGTMAVLYGSNPDVAWTATYLAGLAELTGGFAQCAALSYLVFNLLCAPCFAAMGAIKREMGGFNKWFWGAIGYQMLWAWVVALMFFNFGRVALGGAMDVWFFLAVICAAVILFMLFRPYPKQKDETEA